LPLLPLYFPPVDRHLKERLVGAAVLLAVANILISEMLSGPASDSGDAAVGVAVTADGSPIKTYTIDLRQREQSDTVDSSVMPPPELPVPLVAQAPIPAATQEPQSAQSDTQAAVPIEPQPKVEQPMPLPSKSTVQTDEKPDPKPEPKPEPKLEPKPTAGGWAIQVASLGTRAAAERMAGELKRDGFTTFVMPVQVNGKTLFRVRVGPVATRQAADALLPKVKRLHAAAAVVTQG
jgi:DedD protein